MFFFLLLSSCFLCGCLTSSSRSATLPSRPALLHCWCSWERVVSHTAAVLSPALTHSVQITGASIVTPLTAPLPLPSLLSAWADNQLVNRYRLTLPLHVCQLSCSREFAFSLPKERGWEAKLPVLIGKEVSGFLGPADYQTSVFP